jgi:hypothetical protein
MKLFCAYCGQRNGEGAKFCLACGKELHNPQVSGDTGSGVDRKPRRRDITFAELCRSVVGYGWFGLGMMFFMQALAGVSGQGTDFMLKVFGMGALFYGAAFWLPGIFIVPYRYRGFNVFLSDDSLEAVKNG